MVVYTPTDDATRRAIASLIAGRCTDARFACWPEHYGAGLDDSALATGSLPGRPARHAARVLP
jgi:hypothetical protein